jgi:hypothetical protein
MDMFGITKKPISIFCFSFTGIFLLMYGLGGGCDVEASLVGAIGAAVGVTMWDYWRNGEPEERSAGNDSSTKEMPTR